MQQRKKEFQKTRYFPLKNMKVGQVVHFDDVNLHRRTYLVICQNLQNSLDNFFVLKSGKIVH